jgi:hypothetical protein
MNGQPMAEQPTNEQAVDEQAAGDLHGADPGRSGNRRRLFVIAASLGLAGVLVAVGVLVTGSSHGKNAGQGSPNPVGGTTNTDAIGSGAAGSTATASGGADASATATTAASSGASVTGSAVGAVSLSGWKLTLPVSSSGALSGNARQLSTAAVTAPWLTRNADGSLSFWAPATGATTPNSQHARTELVSTNDFQFGSGAHTLSARVAVTQVPSSDPDICLGQIHGGGSINSVAFVMLHWRAGDIVVVIKKALKGSSSQTVTLLTGVPLGAAFTFTLADNGDGGIGLSATYAGSDAQLSVTAASAFVGTDQRFQVGDYQQAVSGTSASDGGRATFYAIRQS